MAEAYHALKEGKIVCVDGLEYKIIKNKLHYRSRLDGKPRIMGDEEWNESAYQYYANDEWEIKEDEKEIEAKHINTIQRALAYTLIHRTPCNSEELSDALSWLNKKFCK